MKRALQPELVAEPVFIVLRAARSARDVVAGFPLAGSTLEICGEDARVIYVLTVRLDLYGYIAQWPD